MRLLSSCVLCAVMISLLLVPVGAPAQVPQTMNYQVMLTDDSDQPLADQSVQLVFRIYNLEAGGGQLWTETHNVITNSIGVVSVVLGSTNPLAISFDGPLWLQVEVDSEVLSPRRQLTSAPYALSAGGSGGGDGHSLDADDGSPVDALYVDSNGDVGVGTTSPQAELHVREELQVGSTATLGVLTVHGGSAANGAIRLQGEGTDGGSIYIDGGMGSTYVTLGPTDQSGGGGRLILGKNSEGTTGILLEGNYNDNEEPGLLMIGSSRTLQLYMGGGSSDYSVLLPNDSINADEILDEPGVASAVDAGSGSFTGSVQSLDVRSISAPTNGYILAIGTAELGLYHTYNTSNNITSVQVGLTDGYPTVPASQDLVVSVPDRAGSGTYRQVATVHGVFPATAGLTKTVRMYAWRTMGTAGYFRNVHITLLFIPTARGTVETISATAAQGGEPATDEFRAITDPGGTPNAIIESGDSVTIPRELLDDILARIEELEHGAEAPNPTP